MKGLGIPWLYRILDRTMAQDTWPLVDRTSDSDLTSFVDINSS